MKIITSGLSFMDIDAYGGCVAYAELLNLQGDPAVAYSSAAWNESITETIRAWNAPLATEYTATADDSFVLIDVSEPEFVDKVVSIDKVCEVIDHHIGYEEFWKEKIGDKANIEFIGAACTQVFESWQKANLLPSMTELSARLLIAGILDNTLNFKAKITTERDVFAYDELLKIANLPDDWTAQYFRECEDSIFADIEGSLVNDTKVVSVINLNGDKIGFGQMVIWDASRAINEHLAAIQKTMATKSSEWFVNIVSIKDGCSYFLSSNDRLNDWAEDMLDVRFTNNLATADRLWLRKEIIKQTIAQSYAGPQIKA